MTEHERQILEDELKALPDTDRQWAAEAEQAAEHVLFDPIGG